MQLYNLLEINNIYICIVETEGQNDDSQKKARHETEPQGYLIFLI